MARFSPPSVNAQLFSRARESESCLDISTCKRTSGPVIQFDRRLQAFDRCPSRDLWLRCAEAKDFSIPVVRRYCGNEGRRLFGHALWILLETSARILREQ